MATKIGNKVPTVDEQEFSPNRPTKGAIFIVLQLDGLQQTSVNSHRWFVCTAKRQNNLDYKSKELLENSTQEIEQKL